MNLAASCMFRTVLGLRSSCRRVVVVRAWTPRDAQVDGPYLDVYVREVCPLIAHDRDPLACLHRIRVPDLDDQMAIARLADHIDGASMGSLKGVVVWLLSRGETERALVALQEFEQLNQSLETLHTIVRVAIDEMNLNLP